MVTSKVLICDKHNGNLPLKRQSSIFESILKLCMVYLCLNGFNGGLIISLSLGKGLH